MQTAGFHAAAVATRMEAAAAPLAMANAEEQEVAWYYEQAKRSLEAMQAVTDVCERG